MSTEPNHSLLHWIGRTDPLFAEDLHRHCQEIDDAVAGARFLVVGGAGSIGGAVVRELFRRKPAALHVVDTSENNLAELVRDLRASLGYIQGDFHAYCFDGLGTEFDALAKASEKPGCGYDYVLNFSALKHVRSEKDPYTLMRMIDVNVFLPRKLLAFAKRIGAKKFFCVSTDKAANPVNLMGGSKRVMEMYLAGHGGDGVDGGGLAVSTARFANVAFSDGSLPAAWANRIAKRQPVSAPNDVRRYFVTSQESAELCLFSILQGNDREIFFPKLDPKLHLTTFSSMAESYLRFLGWEPYRCESEDEARGRIDELIAAKRWPCYFFESDTTGEKDFEEFFTDTERVDWDRYHEIGIVHNDANASTDSLQRFVSEIDGMRSAGDWTKASIVAAFEKLLPHFAHHELGKNLDNRM